MSIICIHDNWPQWMIEYIEREIAKSPDGRFSISVPRRRNLIGRKLGQRIGKKLDIDMKKELEEG